MTIQIDTREKNKIIQPILTEFDRQGIKWFKSKLFVGDYMDLDNTKLVIDRKHNLQEICNNVVQDHKRFCAELARANRYGIHVVVLIEHSKNIKTLEDVRHWVNPRLKVSPLAVSGERLYKILFAISEHYDTEFVFCEKKDTGKKIIEILSRGTK